MVPQLPADVRAKQKYDRAAVCDRCFRPKEACFCGAAPSFDTAIRVVILQHPREQLKALNSARLAKVMLNNSALFVGLSWRNFKLVAGPKASPSEWGVLFFKPERIPGGRPLSIMSRKPRAVEDAPSVRGIITLDGSWKQAKALWWRNPWLLKLNRIQLNPDHPSLRPQVKREGLSTIEAVAFALEHLGEERRIAEALRSCYEKLIIEA